MRDDTRAVIGINIRGDKGKKWCVTGSHLGLFWPEGVEIESDDTWVFCEGASDCGTLLTLGYCAIGRPSNVAGTEYIKRLLAMRRRDVIVMADNDEEKTLPDGTTYYPGERGAEQLCKIIAPMVKSLKMVKPPKLSYDIRTWVNSGATRDVIECVIRNTQYLRRVT
jgi:hypothetical protein